MAGINKQFIRRRIKELGYTQAGAARRAEISLSGLRKIIYEDRSPNPFTLVRLARMLEVPEGRLTKSKHGKRRAS